MTSKPLAALLGLVLGFAAAAVGWKAWRLLTGQDAFALSAGGRTSPATPPAGFGMTAPAEAAEEIAGRLPEPDLPQSGVTDVEPVSAAEAGVDQVLEVLAAEGPVREPATVQGRFGPSAFSPDEGGACPPEHPVKGNAKSMIFHQPGQSSYGATMADVCFPDAAAAEAAGFRPSKSGGQVRH